MKLFIMRLFITEAITEATIEAIDIRLINMRRFKGHKRKCEMPICGTMHDGRSKAKVR